MKCHKLAQGILPVAGVITLASGCASTNDLYAKYEDVCELPKPVEVERVKIVKEVVEKERVVEKVVNKVRVVEKPVEKIKYIEKIKPVEKIKIVEKPVEKIKYVDRVQKVMVPQVVEKIKVVKQPVPVHGAIWEPAVYFGFDLDSLNNNEQARLDRDLLVLKRNPKLKLSVQAFTDSRGSNQYNRNLALRRQETVVNYLMGKGLARDRILVSPLGEELPILGESKAERVINRRVELMLLDASGRPLSLAVQPKATDFKAPSPVK